ncbi:MAG TPA: MarR family transcriptional regulator [Trebonia sp.]|nr:MarR family transcriptional regulator [Trebonia sp.]
MTDLELAVGLSGGLERVVGLLRALAQPSGLSMTSVSTMAALEQTGPARLTALANRAGVTQPAMTQLISRLEDAGLVRREADIADGRVVQVAITDEGRATMARRRAGRAVRLAGILAQLSPEYRAALAAAVPALDALASARRDEDPVPA